MLVNINQATMAEDQKFIWKALFQWQRHKRLIIMKYKVIIRLPVSHCVPLKPGAQLQLNPFTRSVQIPLFWHGWLAQSSIISVSGDQMNKI